jgi:hypothetical protein
MQSHSLRQYQVKNQLAESNTAIIKNTVNDMHWRPLNPLGIKGLGLGLGLTQV